MNDVTNTEELEIWQGDLFARIDEARQIEAYIESIAADQLERGGGRGYTLAINAPYGVGKTFFLTRLQKHMGLRHPVAYVDAWADDLLDEPLTAIAATLEVALKPYINKGLKKQWNAFLRKSGNVAKIAATGAVKRGVGMIITGGSTHLLTEEFGSSSFMDGASGEVEHLGTEVVDGAEKAVRSGGNVMAGRIKKFNEGRNAITALKTSLAAIVDGLTSLAKRPPIVIIIDELDRCRPTYAVKLLEEVKHLFDVPGVIFILGMNGEQLAKSVSGAYGPAFDGEAYLRRFINKRYDLIPADLDPMIQLLFEQSGLDTRRLITAPLPAVNSTISPSKHKLLAKYMAAYDLTARDAIHICDALRTFMALTKGPILAPLLFPLLIQSFIGQPVGDFSAVSPKIVDNFQFLPPNSRTGVQFVQLARQLLRVKIEDARSIHNLDPNQLETYLLLKLYDDGRLPVKDVVPPKAYVRIVRYLGNFSSPEEQS